MDIRRRLNAKANKLIQTEGYTEIVQLLCDASDEIRRYEKAIEIAGLRIVEQKPPVSAFERFWSAYPCKKGKPVAQKAFRKVEGEFEAIMAGLDAYRRHKPEYADWMHPSTFLNQRRWEDEYDAPVRQQTHDARKDGLALLLQEAKRREADVGQGEVSGNVVQFLPRADLERGDDEGEGGGLSVGSGALF